jgi:hypothetical protein
LTLKYVQHQKISLKSHPEFNEAWLHDRIADDPAILGLGDVRVLDRERTLTGGGRLDMLLLDEDNNRRFEIEVMLGATDPSHIIRTIEYWDIERRRYPGYEHVAVLIAEDVTARFLNVMSLLSGSIPFIAIQLDALKVDEQILLNFVQVLDQTELRIDDTDVDSGGGETTRQDWDQRSGKDLMHLCDSILELINGAGEKQRQLNYLKGYIGLRSNGVVRNFIALHPRRTKRLIHIGFRNSKAAQWKDRFEEAGMQARSHHKDRFRLSVTPGDFKEHQDLIQEAILETAKEFDG